MPQVEAVGSLSHPAQRCEIEHAPECGSGHDGSGDGDGGEQGDGGQAALVDERSIRGHENGRGDEGAQAHGAEGGQKPACPARPPEWECGPALAQHGQGGADGEPEAVRVGSVVHAGGVRAWQVDERHCEGGCDAERNDDAEAKPPHPHQDQKQYGQRPEQVELLLDGERPEVAEQLGRRFVEVAPVAGNGEPVAAEGGRPGHLSQKVDEHVAADRPGGRAAQQHQGEERG